MNISGTRRAVTDLGLLRRLYLFTFNALIAMPNYWAMWSNQGGHWTDLPTLRFSHKLTHSGRGYLIGASQYRPISGA
jgi:hypothetical protein